MCGTRSMKLHTPQKDWLGSVFFPRAPPLLPLCLKHDHCPNNLMVYFTYIKIRGLVQTQFCISNWYLYIALDGWFIDLAVTNVGAANSAVRCWKQARMKGWSSCSNYPLHVSQVACSPLSFLLSFCGLSSRHILRMALLSALGFRNS